MPSKPEPIVERGGNLPGTKAAHRLAETINAVWRERGLSARAHVALGKDGRPTVFSSLVNGLVDGRMNAADPITNK
jgi:hypothetical protein